VRPTTLAVVVVIDDLVIAVGDFGIGAYLG